MYKTGTIAGSVGDLINIGVDLYDEKYENALVRGLNGFVSSKFEKIIKTSSDKADNLYKSLWIN